MSTTRIVRFHELGSADVLQIEDLPLEEPGAGEVRIKVEAIGLNRAEVLFRQGQYLEQPTFPSRIGVEAAGIVEAVGTGVTNVAVGDRVSVATGQGMARYGTYGETALVPAHSAVKYPANLTPVEAASLWVQYLTAYFAFVDVAHLQPGQHVLITAASGGAGVGALEIARLLGAKTIATTRTSAKKQALLDAGADYVIATGEENLPERVREITGGRGAELVFDPIAGQELLTTAEAAAPGGQILIYGTLGGGETPYPLRAAFTKGFTIRAYSVYAFTGQPDFGLPRNEEAFARAVGVITEGLASGSLKPLIAKTFPFDAIRDAHRYMESNAQLGKIVVTV
jgi:NADPH:quinone reductase-like Zn-dependent oxidoreductase